jgi:murein DD-endopeptidase MepM/ murein hydrolase activator NlpD
MPDAKAVSPSALAAGLQSAPTSQDAARAADANRASRATDRSSLASTPAADVWALPLRGYTFTTPYGVRYGKLHAGIDLAAPEGTPYRAIHAGTVTKAGWFGGYGYCVIVKHADGTEAIYGHSSQLLVKPGQQVKAGDQLGLVGNTGHTYGTHLYLEIHVNGMPKDPITFLMDRVVDIKLEMQAISADVAVS